MSNGAILSSFNLLTIAGPFIKLGFINALNLSRFFFIPIFLAFFLLPTAVNAQEGTLDTSFGGTGYVTTNFKENPDVEESWEVAVQPDGKIIAGGYAGSYLGFIGGNHVYDYDIVLARYNQDGSLDLGFGDEGKVVIDEGEYDFVWDGIVFQSDGKIIIAGGNFAGANQNAYVYRLNYDGSFDTSFGTNGVSKVDQITYFDAVAIQSDGKIVATGAKLVGAPGSGEFLFIAVRFNLDGSLDQTFGDDGIVLDTLDIPYASGEAIKLQDDGKMVITVQYGRLIRLNEDGSLDQTFGTGGIVSTENVTTLPYGLGIQSDGKIVIGGNGETSVFGADGFALARYNSDGSLDTSFGQQGKAFSSFNGSGGYAMKLVIHPDGKIILGGYLGTSSGTDFALLRFNPNGTLDSTFGNDGIGTLDINNSDSGMGLDMQTNGQLLISGSTEYTAGDRSFVVARFNGTPIIQNTAPEITSIIAPTDPKQLNTALNISATFTDPNMNDLHTAFWDFGDGNTSPGVVEENLKTVSGSHTYNAAGVYTVKLTLMDSENASDEEIYQFIVIYNPDGGFVTGAGMINSPIGAYKADLSLSGLARFGFVSKYQHGANVPTGNTQFQFNAADLKFKSTDYQWLVVAGNKAMFKGSGQINDQGNYGFMLVALDGDFNNSSGEDKFRIKIWEIGNGDILVYDNYLGTGDDTAVDTSITQGKITIQK